MVHASRGTREVAGAAQPLEDQISAQLLAHLGRRITLTSLAWAVIFTAIVVVLPRGGLY